MSSAWADVLMVDPTNTPNIPNLPILKRTERRKYQNRTNTPKQVKSPSEWLKNRNRKTIDTKKSYVYGQKKGLQICTCRPLFSVGRLSLQHK